MAAPTASAAPPPQPRLVSLIHSSSTGAPAAAAVCLLWCDAEAFRQAGWVVTASLLGMLADVFQVTHSWPLPPDVVEV